MENRWLDLIRCFFYKGELAKGKVGRFSLRIYEDTKAEMDSNDSSAGT